MYASRQSKPDRRDRHRRKIACAAVAQLTRQRKTAVTASSCDADHRRHSALAINQLNKWRYTFGCFCASLIAAIIDHAPRAFFSIRHQRRVIAYRWRRCGCALAKQQKRWLKNQAGRRQRPASASRRIVAISCGCCAASRRLIMLRSARLRPTNRDLCLDLTSLCRSRLKRPSKQPPA